MNTTSELTSAIGPAVSLWMEISRRPDPGGALKAPLEARGGITTPGYELVKKTKPGDLVIHYDGRHEKLIGVSIVSGEQYYEPIWWAARGTTARKAAASPMWLPGVYAPLSGFQALDKPIDRAAILSRTGAILAVRDALKARTIGPLYFPFNPYRDGVRTYQSYLAKFPRELLDVFPELAPQLHSLLSVGVTAPLAESVEAEQRVAELAGKKRTSQGNGQGRRVDPRVRAAVEAHAMNAAFTHFSLFGNVEDKSMSESYDFSVDIDGTEWHIEVKGTSTAGQSVLLTPNEVEHARSYPHVALFVLSDIEIDFSGSDPVVTGGTPRVFHPWSISVASLRPTGFEYALSD